MSGAAPDCEVLVVGAGPAGVAAGVTARRLGLDVLVVDRARFPRDKTCGDGLTAGALRALEALGLDVRALPSYVHVAEAVLVAPSGRRVALPLPADGEHAAVVPRAELDAAMVEHARVEGVDVRDGVGVVAVHDDAGAVRVGLDDGTGCSARWVIAADGHYSATRRLLDASRATAGDASTTATPADLGTWHAFRQYFHGVDDDRLFVLFDADLLPGYAWVFPVGGGRANVGFGVLRDRRAGASGKQLAALWRDVIDRPAMRDVLGARAEPDATHRAWPIPARYDPARLTSGRVLFAGDAAGVVDAMTGEGIAQALETGAAAARAIARDATPYAVTTRYRREVARALGRDLRFASALQHVLRVPLGAEAAIAAAGATSWTRRNFARWMFEDYPRAALLSPSRWSRGAFTPPGAYATTS
ncbi:MAG: geranylgeranyl reductase family protein [Acidimicrobiia bacterium]